MILVHVIFLIITLWLNLDCAFKLYKGKVQTLVDIRYQINDNIRFVLISKKTQLFSKSSPDDDSSNFFDNSDESITYNAEEIGLTYSKKKLKKNSDKRDLLPFDIYLEINSDIKIGSFMLDSSTACGDIVDLGSKGIYNVKKVTFLYRYESDGLRVFKKKLHLNSMKGSNSDIRDMISFANTSPFKVQNDTTYLQ